MLLVAMQPNRIHFYSNNLVLLMPWYRNGIHCLNICTGLLKYDLGFPP